jgi:hypothetical protein
METTNIYVLIDPITDQVRYVGKANNVLDRFSNHMNRAKRHTPHKLAWINSLKQKGLKPIVEVVDVVPIDDWQFWEVYWISQFKTWGFDLLNYTWGGDGATFANQTSFKKGRKVPQDTNTFIDCQQCGKNFKISPSRIGIKKYCSKVCYANSKKGIRANPNGEFKKGETPWNKGLTYKNKKIK